MIPARTRYLSVVGLVVVLDQLTKWVVDRTLALHESRPMIEGLLSLTYVRNRGGAFGVLAEADLPHQSIVFSLVSLLALAAIVAYAWRLPAESRRSQSALALVMAGAVGNLLDRARLGYVVDFVDFYWGSHHWPAFNVADSAITVGVALLVLDVLREPHAPPAPEVGTPAGRSE